MTFVGLYFDFPTNSRNSRYSLILLRSLKTVRLLAAIIPIFPIAEAFTMLPILCFGPVRFSISMAIKQRGLKPALENRSVENIFLIGTSGTGKTTIAKWILESHFKEVSVYVNCWKHRTTHEVLKEILLKLQIPVHGREPTGDLTVTLEKTVKKKKVIVCLDEVDRLNDFDLLYLLARSNCGFILISTRCHVLASLTNRIRSSLALTEIEFPPYKTDELYDILHDRVEYAFRPGSLKNEFVKLA